MTHGDAREGKWRGNWRMECVASTLHTTSEHGVSSITTSDVHISAASSGLNWRPYRFKGARPFRRKTKCGFCACAITFQKHSTPRPGLYYGQLMLSSSIVATRYSTVSFLSHFFILRSHKPLISFTGVMVSGCSVLYPMLNYFFYNPLSLTLRV